jgi:Family of unknown function (DUF6188)
MHSFDWLIEHWLISLIRREHDWLFVFDSGCNLVVGCLWRLIANNRICMTSEDDGHQFGLPAPKNAVDIVTARIADHTILKVEVRDEILDLRVHFDGGCVLEVIPDSTGYEAWNLQQQPGQEWIALGGGDLVEFKE